MAFVFGVIAFSISSGLILYVSGSISTNFGVAPVYEMASQVAMNVNGVVITSSPLPIPLANNARCRADVPEFTPTEYFELQKDANSFSKLLTFSPKIKLVESSTWCMALSISCLIESYWAFKSTNLIILQYL